MPIEQKLTSPQLLFSVFLPVERLTYFYIFLCKPTEEMNQNTAFRYRTYNGFRMSFRYYHRPDRIALYKYPDNHLLELNNEKRSSGFQYLCVVFNNESACMDVILI